MLALGLVTAGGSIASYFATQADGTTVNLSGRYRDGRGRGRAGIGSSVAPGPAPSSLLTGLVAYWKLDGNGNDSLTTHNATEAGHPAVWISGKIGQSVTWTEATGYGLLDFSGTPAAAGTTFTISVWVRPPNPAGFGDGYGGIISPVSGNAFYLNTVHPRLYPAAAADATLADGVWYHLVVTGDSETLHYYVNGAADAQTPAYSTSLTLAYIGASSNAGSECISGTAYNGSVDELGVWSRVLSGAEITTLFSAGTGKTYPFN